MYPYLAPALEAFLGMIFATAFVNNSFAMSMSVL